MTKVLYASTIPQTIIPYLLIMFLPPRGETQPTPVPQVKTPMDYGHLFVFTTKLVPTSRNCSGKKKEVSKSNKLLSLAFTYTLALVRDSLIWSGIVNDSPRQSQIVPYSPRQSQIVSDSLRESQIVLHSPRQSQIFPDCPRQSQRVLQNPKQSEIIRDSLRLSEIVRDSPRQSQMVPDSHRQSQIV